MLIFCLKKYDVNFSYYFWNDMPLAFKMYTVCKVHLNWISEISGKEDIRQGNFCMQYLILTPEIQLLYLVVLVVEHTETKKSIKVGKWRLRAVHYIVPFLHRNNLRLALIKAKYVSAIWSMVSKLPSTHEKAYICAIRSCSGA